MYTCSWASVIPSSLGGSGPLTVCTIPIATPLPAISLSWLPSMPLLDRRPAVVADEVVHPVQEPIDVVLIVEDVRVHPQPMPGVAPDIDRPPAQERGQLL